MKRLLFAVPAVLACSSPAPDGGASKACDVVMSPCQSTQVAVSPGANPHLALLSGDEIFYGSFKSSGLPVLSRLSISDARNDVLLDPAGGEPGFGLGPVAADETNVYFVADGAHSAELRRLVRGATTAAGLDSTETQPPKNFVGDVVTVGNEVFYSLVAVWMGGRVGPPGGLFAVDKAGGMPRKVVDAASGRALRAFGDSLFFAYVATDEVGGPDRTGATLVRIPMAGGAPEIVGEAGNAPPQFEVDGSGIVWVQGGSLMTMPLTGGVPRRLFSPSSPTANFPILNAQFALDGGFAFVSVNRVTNDPSLVRTELFRVPLDGRPVSSLFRSSESNDLGTIGVLKDSVYFPQNTPTPVITSVPRCGCGVPEGSP